MIRTSFAAGRVHVGERDAVLGTTRTFAGQQPAAIVFCHGSGETTTSTLEKAATRDLVFKLARHHTVVAADLGGQTWGNDTAIARIGEAITFLRANYGSTGKVILVGGSMGACNALAYTRAHPENVAAVAGIIPLTDIVDVMGRGAAAEVNTAYGGTYSDAAHGPLHNPIRFAASLSSSIPIYLWSSPTDALTPYATAQAFVAARPQTGLTALPNTGHSDASVEAATAGVVEFVDSL